jgi:hypothetical protein
MQNSLTGIIDQIHHKLCRPKITRDQYDDWQHGFIFDGLRNLSYGQSFCRRFGIQDHVLDRSSSAREMDQYIRKFYVR